MELFQTYEEEWTANTQGLEEQIAQVPTLSGKERDSLVKTIRERLLDAEDSVDGMGIACRGTKEDKDLAARLKTYRSELDEFKGSLQRSQHAINPNAQRDLLGGDEHDFGTSAEHRALFGGQNETQSLMSAGDDLILQATRDTLEIEETAMQVMQDLSDQVRCRCSFFHLGFSHPFIYLFAEDCHGAIPGSFERYQREFGQRRAFDAANDAPIVWEQGNDGRGDFDSDWWCDCHYLAALFPAMGRYCGPWKYDKHYGSNISADEGKNGGAVC